MPRGVKLISLRGGGWKLIGEWVYILVERTEIGRTTWRRSNLMRKFASFARCVKFDLLREGDHLPGLFEGKLFPSN